MSEGRKEERNGSVLANFVHCVFSDMAKTNQSARRKGSFWLMVSEVSVHSCGPEEGVVEQGCSPD
jgi:hypothetical protein